MRGFKCKGSADSNMDMDMDMDMNMDMDMQSFSEPFPGFRACFTFKHKNEMSAYYQL